MLKPHRTRNRRQVAGTGIKSEKPDLLVSRRSVLTASATVLFAGKTAAAANATDAGRIVQPAAPEDPDFIQRAFDMRQKAVDLGDQAYGAVVVRDAVIIGQSWSRVVLDTDPTAHAELAAIRDAARRTGNRNLRGAVLYSSSRPCPMCEAAAYWAGIETMKHGRSISNAGRPHLCR